MKKFMPGLFVALSLVLVGNPAFAKTITFKHACDSGKRTTIAAVGDLLFHKKLQVQALSKKGRYKDFWQPVTEFLARADVTYGNLEGAIAPGLGQKGKRFKDRGRIYDPNVHGYTLDYLSFNYHPSLIDDLKSTGFDIVSTANNHALDRGWRGANMTVDLLREKQLLFSGTFKSGEKPTFFSERTRLGGMTIAWLACSYSTNGLPDPKKQIALCYKHRERILKEIRTLSSSKFVDAVILVPHWGVENALSPNRRQRKLGVQAIEAGALAVIGTHAHVVQPWKKHITEDGREGLIIYSTGNFISNQRKLMQRVAGIVMLDLVKTKDGARIAGAAHVPTWVSIAGNRNHRVILADSPKASKAAYNKLMRVWPSGNKVPLIWPIKFPKKCN